MMRLSIVVPVSTEALNTQRDAVLDVAATSVLSTLTAQASKAGRLLVGSPSVIVTKATVVNDSNGNAVDSVGLTLLLVQCDTGEA